MISASTRKAATEPHNIEAAIRMICRAVIRRVRNEFPHIDGYELYLRFWAAYPFGADDVLQAIFQEEVLQAVGNLGHDGLLSTASESEPYAYTASPYLQ